MQTGDSEHHDDDDGLPAPLVVFRDGALRSANPAACRELGRRPDDLLGGGFVASLDAESGVALEKAITQPFGSGAPPRRITVQRPASVGGDDFFELRLQPAADSSVTALVIDVTEMHRLDAAIGALSSATIALDTSAQMAWRPFGNAERFGITDDDALGSPMLGLIHPDELPRLLEVFGRLLEEPGSRQCEMIRMRHPYVEDGWLVSRITAVNRLDDPAIAAVVVRTEDAAPIDLVDDLAQTSGVFRSLAEAAPVGIIVTDRSGTVLYGNDLARRLLQLDRETAGPGEWLAGVPDEPAADLDRLLTEAREQGRRGSLLLRLEHPDRDRVWLRVDAVPQIDERGRTFGVIATLLDVTNETETREQLTEAQERLWHLATHDSLTGLDNRMLFLEKVAQALAASSTDHRGVALLYCDLDGFKPVNDRYGHAVGDQVLTVVANRLSKVIRGTDSLSRFGGDEFLVLCDGFVSQHEVDALADRMRSAVTEPIDIDGLVIEVGMTVGIAYADGDTRVDELITNADDSMYAAKGQSTHRRRTD